jgi:3-deoxy-D-manno-octulosonic-acid transferase
MRVIYNALLRIAAPLAFAVVLARGLRDPAYWRHLSERFGYGEGRTGTAGVPRFWLHAVSLGEVSAAAALVRALRKRFPALALVVTTATPTGRARAEALFGTAADVHFLPYDLPAAMERFLDRVRPSAVLIMETELWPNLFRACARRGLPVVLASARLSQRSVSRYRRFGGLFRELFTPNVWVAAQTPLDAGRFTAIGAAAERTRVVGNVKFDITIDPELQDDGRALRRGAFAGRAVWVAGSTHEGEEEQVLAAHARVRAALSGALLLLAPRHPQRFDAVAALLTRRGAQFVRRSAGVAVPATADVLLVDTVGELLHLYAAADVAFVGGSLVSVGGHNLLEPAALGLPVLTGPSDANGREIAALLLGAGAALRVADAAALGDAVAALLSSPAERLRIGTIGATLVAANRGGVARIVALLEPLLGELPGPAPTDARPGSP